jgi:shikimate kinase
MEWMNDTCCTIYLKTPASVLAARLKHEMHLRPLLANVSPQNLELHIEKLLSHRAPFYDQSTITVNYNADGTAFEELLLNMLDGLQ